MMRNTNLKDDMTDNIEIEIILRLLCYSVWARGFSRQGALQISMCIFTTMHIKLTTVDYFSLHEKSRPTGTENGRKLLKSHELHSTEYFYT